MTYIHKKDGNVIIPKSLVNGHWKSKEQQDQVSSRDNVSYLPGVSPVSTSKEDKWYGYGAAASLMIVLGAIFVLKPNVGDDRSLASTIQPTVQEDQKVVHNLRAGQRELQSIGVKKLTLREKLEHEMFRHYHVSFDHDDQVVSVELQPHREPIFIPHYQTFFKKYKAFFSSLKSVRKAGEAESDGLRTITFQSKSTQVLIQENSQGYMISLNIKEI